MKRIPILQECEDGRRPIRPPELQRILGGILMGLEIQYGVPVTHKDQVIGFIKGAGIEDLAGKPTLFVAVNWTKELPRDAIYPNAWVDLTNMKLISLDISADQPNFFGFNLLRKETAMETEKELKFKPVGNHVVIKRDSDDAISEEDQNKPTQGMVVAVGPGHVENGRWVRLQVQSGDRVVFRPYASSEVELNGSKYAVVGQHQILSVLEDANGEIADEPE